MFSKLGRNGGTGRGSGNRPLSTPSQLHRPGEGSVSRPPIGASGPLRARPGAPSIAVSLPGREETFSLEPGALDFGAIIRLTPDIVKEIKRLEAHGGSAKIKFDENANNSAGNVVEVDGKEFRFTWSRELTDLCDIYEERQNGDHGDGLLVECGAAWRKLNVQRILDESTKNHVKMRSEEAERMLKSRKAIVLDPTNPSVKNQAKSMAAAAVEGNMRRMGWKHKKEMFSKKNKVENNQGAAALSQSKSVSKSATASKSNSKGIPSPVLSPQQPQPITLLSSSGTGKASKGDTNPEAITPLLTINKEEVDIIVKEMPTGFGDSIQEINGYKERNIDPLIDLESMLITLLSQNPRGMSLKALEKAVGETVANPAKKIENALKNIATLQTPGRYFLKQGRHVESSTRSSEGGSSPECSNKKVKRTVPVLFENAIVERSDQGIQSLKNEKASDPIERIDVMQITGDQLYVEVKDKENSVIRAGSCSDSESDSDSDSSSSGSDSGSQSKSKAGSGSASCSDSESDRTSSSKEASDMDVDIMISDDEKGVAVESMDAMVSGLSPRTRLWRSDGEHNVDTNEIDQKANDISLDLHDSENLYEMVNLVTDTKNLPTRSAQTFEKLEAKKAKNIDSYLQQSKSRYSVVYQDNNKVTENQHESPFGSFNNDRLKITGRQSVIDEQTLMKAGSQQLYNHENVTKINTKRSSNSDHHVEKSQNAKRMKASSSTEGSFRKSKAAHSSHGSSLLSSDIAMQMDQKIKVSNSNQRDERRETNLLDEDLQEHAGSAVARNTGTVQSSPDFGGPSNFSAEKSGKKVVDSSGRKRNNMEKPIKHVESNRKVGKHLQTMSAPPETDISALKNMQVDRISTVKGKLDEDGDIKDKYLAKNAKEIITGERMSSAPDLVNTKPTDGHVNEKGNFLRRESSDLELGEFREPFTHVMREDKRPFETKNSFKKVENKVALLDSKIDINMNKCDGIGVSEEKKQSPPILRGRMDGKVSADGILDVGRSSSRFMQSQYRQTSRMDVTDLETIIHLDSCAESGGKTGTSNDHVMGVENEACALMKTTSTRTLKDDNRHGALVGRKSVKESQTDKLSGLKRSTEHDNYGFTTSNGTNSRKSMKFSSDEENIPSIKYKNAVLDLRGPIKDLSMYKDYVQEYQEKYSHYFSLNKKLDKIRNDFLEVGDNLELARGRNMEEYYVIVEKLRQMYRQHGEGHKEMKRIYILLHEELKTLKQRIKDFVAVHSRE